VSGFSRRLQARVHVCYAAFRAEAGSLWTFIKKLVEQYGEDLVCVRYRYDPEQSITIKIIELIIERSPWRRNPDRIPGNKIMRIRIEYGEVELGRSVKAAGGKWNRKDKVWELPYKEVLALGLRERIISGEHENV